MTKKIAIPLILFGVIGPGVVISNLPAGGEEWPYWLAAPAISSLALGICMAVGIFKFPRMAMRVEPAAGEFLLSPQVSAQTARRNAIVGWFCLSLPAIVLAAVLELTHRQLPAVGHLLTGVALLLFVAQTGAHFVHKHRARLRNRSQLFISRDAIHLDEPFRMRLPVVAGARLAAKELRLRLVCYEHSLMHVGRYMHLVIRLRDELTFPLAGPATLQPDQSLAGTAEVLLDSVRYPPSGPWGKSSYPFYRWEVRVEWNGTAGPAAVFPIVVFRQKGAAEAVA